MNCLEFRRAATADPRRLEAGAAAHALQCRACREFHARAIDFERRLKDAVLVPVPPDLGNRVFERVAQRRAVRWYALAAAIVLAVGLAGGVALAPDDPMALAGIDFVVYEEAQAIADAKPVDAAVLQRVEREMKVSLPEQLGDIRYVCFYPFSAGPAHHLLLTTPLGKVTLLLIPGRSVAARASASARGLEAAVMPLGGGALAIVAGSRRSIARVETLMKTPL